MSIRTIVRGLSALLLGFALSFIAPIVTALCYGEPLTPFLIPSLILIGVSGMLLLIIPRRSSTYFTRDSFAIVTLFWTLVCIVGAVPFVLSIDGIGWVDALFEAASGFTTTGATIYSDVEVLPKSILLWRSLTHWLGGMGIIVLAVAVLPILGVSGFRLMSAEAPGPDIEKLTPRITHTARVFWLIYFSFTIVETALLIFGGMGVFDAINHTFATLATGGFSTKNASIAAFNSSYIEWVVILFMFLSGINFALYFRALTGRFDIIRNNSELKAYVFLFTLAVLIVAASLYFTGEYSGIETVFRYSAFQVATLMTSTGFATADYTLWPMLPQGMLLLMLFIGGCVGSTSGGIKMMHVTVMIKTAGKQLRSLVYPRGMFPIRLNKKPLDSAIVTAVSGFVFLYIVFVVISTIVVVSSGTDITTALTASLACIGNIGPGFGDVGPASNFAFFPDYVKLWLAAIMILGRLEIYTVLILFTPFFYHK
ncbi:MAG: TrkH family potassium uptake protein [Spirochaetaceae bacterium]|nr:TrkH family potassium uptake protein [Spirochaetaceae bacterium]MCF7948918.1 TrkH family potassium uptake protein [Spirochaetia bacterium]MCF7951073.1 TrkH family potassium uptake protein [Spirochaetaceae bacterium]